LFTGLICSFVAYSAGQFASMLIRSGIIAAVAGVLLAAALCGWTLLMRSLQVPFWWSVWPIPLVLLLATWLRAPDWTRENYRWPAWTRLAASVLVPCAILFTTMAIFRVHQVPVASPGFDVAEYQSQVAQGLATADIYEQAIRKWPLPLDELPAQLKSLGQMPPDILKLAILANQQPICHFLDSVQGKAYNARIYDFNLLSEALFASGQQLAGEGKLDAALNRDFEALQLLNRLYNPEAWGDGQFNYQATGRNNFFTRFTNWAGIKDQTPQRIRDAIQRLQAIHPADLHLDDAVKDEYFIANRAIQGDESANTVFYSGYYRPTTGDFLLTMLMPWERHRADRVLNALTQAELSLMQRVLEVLDGQLSYGADSGRALSLIIAQVQQGSSWALHYLDRISIDIPGVGPTTIRINLAGLVETTIPNLSEINEVASRAISDLLEFEARRRGTMLVLALQAYRLEHGQLPDSLDELKPDYFQTLPPDPYSGLEFRYFPHGLPFNSDDVPNRPYLWTADYVPGVPGIWCTSPYVNASIEHVDTSSDSDEKPKLKDIVAYFQFSWYGPDHEVITPLNSAENAWARGYWFPIPAAQR
ncbi:MAG TPA: hypothetical protein VMJ32_11755, partial [Pirellulales bacterium]|nr:hypothetical protein [Pirellulales bacterium]